MNQFWPRRSTPQGFSIEKLANGYKQKISENSLSKNQKSVIQLYREKDLSNQNKIKTLTLTNSHWANRDFSEYNKIA